MKESKLKTTIGETKKYKKSCEGTAHSMARKFEKCFSFFDQRNGKTNKKVNWRNICVREKKSWEKI